MFATQLPTGAARLEVGPEIHELALLFLEVYFEAEHKINYSGVNKIKRRKHRFSDLKLKPEAVKPGMA